MQRESELNGEEVGQFDEPLVSPFRDWKLFLVVEHWFVAVLRLVVSSSL